MSKHMRDANGSRKSIRDWESEDDYRREARTSSCTGLVIALMMALSWCVWGMWVQ